MVDGLNSQATSLLPPYYSLSLLLTTPLPSSSLLLSLLLTTSLLTTYYSPPYSPISLFLHCVFLAFATQKLRKWHAKA